MTKRKKKTLVLAPVLEPGGLRCVRHLYPLDYEAPRINLVVIKAYSSFWYVRLNKNI